MALSVLRQICLPLRFGLRDWSEVVHHDERLSCCSLYPSSVQEHDTASASAAVPTPASAASRWELSTSYQSELAAAVRDCGDLLLEVASVGSAAEPVSLGAKHLLDAGFAGGCEMLGSLAVFDLSQTLRVSQELAFYLFVASNKDWKRAVIPRPARALSMGLLAPATVAEDEVWKDRVLNAMSQYYLLQESMLEPLQTVLEAARELPWIETLVVEETLGGPNGILRRVVKILLALYESHSDLQFEASARYRRALWDLVIHCTFIPSWFRRGRDASLFDNDIQAQLVLLFWYACMITNRAGGHFTGLEQPQRQAIPSVRDAESVMCSVAFVAVARCGLLLEGVSRAGRSEEFFPTLPLIHLIQLHNQLLRCQRSSVRNPPQLLELLRGPVFLSALGYVRDLTLLSLQQYHRVFCDVIRGQLLALFADHLSVLGQTFQSSVLDEGAEVTTAAQTVAEGVLDGSVLSETLFFWVSRTRRSSDHFLFLLSQLRPTLFPMVHDNVEYFLFEALPKEVLRSQSQLTRCLRLQVIAALVNEGIVSIDPTVEDQSASLDIAEAVSWVTPLCSPAEVVPVLREYFLPARLEASTFGEKLEVMLLLEVLAYHPELSVTVVRDLAVSFLDNVSGPPEMRPAFAAFWRFVSCFLATRLLYKVRLPAPPETGHQLPSGALSELATILIGRLGVPYLAHCLKDVEAATGRYDESLAALQLLANISHPDIVQVSRVPLSDDQLVFLCQEVVCLNESRAFVRPAQQTLMYLFGIQCILHHFDRACKLLVASSLPPTLRAVCSVLISTIRAPSRDTSVVELFGGSSMTRVEVRQLRSLAFALVKKVVELCVTIVDAAALAESAPASSAGLACPSVKPDVASSLLRSCVRLPDFVSSLVISLDYADAVDILFLLSSRPTLGVALSEIVQSLFDLDPLIVTCLGEEVLQNQRVIDMLLPGHCLEPLLPVLLPMLQPIAGSNASVMSLFLRLVNQAGLLDLKTMLLGIDSRGDMRLKTPVSLALQLVAQQRQFAREHFPVIYARSLESAGTIGDFLAIAAVDLLVSREAEYVALMSEAFLSQDALPSLLDEMSSAFAAFAARLPVAGTPAGVGPGIERDDVLPLADLSRMPGLQGIDPAQCLTKNSRTGSQEYNLLQLHRLCQAHGVSDPVLLKTVLIEAARWNEYLKKCHDMGRFSAGFCRLLSAIFQGPALQGEIRLAGTGGLSAGPFLSSSQPGWRVASRGSAAVAALDGLFAFGPMPPGVAGDALAMEGFANRKALAQRVLHSDHLPSLKMLLSWVEFCQTLLVRIHLIAEYAQSRFCETIQEYCRCFGAVYLSEERERDSDGQRNLLQRLLVRTGSLFESLLFCLLSAPKGGLFYVSRCNLLRSMHILTSVAVASERTAGTTQLGSEPSFSASAVIDILERAMRPVFGRVVESLALDAASNFLELSVAALLCMSSVAALFPAKIVLSRQVIGDLLLGAVGREVTRVDDFRLTGRDRAPGTVEEETDEDCLRLDLALAVLGESRNPVTRRNCLEVMTETAAVLHRRLWNTDDRQVAGRRMLASRESSLSVSVLTVELAARRPFLVLLTSLLQSLEIWSGAGAGAATSDVDRYRQSCVPFVADCFQWVLSTMQFWPRSWTASLKADAGAQDAAAVRSDSNEWPHPGLESVDRRMMNNLLMAMSAFLASLEGASLPSASRADASASSANRAPLAGDLHNGARHLLLRTMSPDFPLRVDALYPVAEDRNVVAAMFSLISASALTLLRGCETETVWASRSYLDVFICLDFHQLSSLVGLAVEYTAHCGVLERLDDKCRSLLQNIARSSTSTGRSTDPELVGCVASLFFRWTGPESGTSLAAAAASANARATLPQMGDSVSDFVGSLSSAQLQSLLTWAQMFCGSAAVLLGQLVDTLSSLLLLHVVFFADPENVATRSKWSASVLHDNMHAMRTWLLKLRRSLESLQQLPRIADRVRDKLIMRCSQMPGL